MAADSVYFRKTGSLTVKDSVKDFGMFCKDVPFTMYGEAKDLSSDDYKDEDGEDEYVPKVLPMKSYTMEVTFAFKGDRDSANKALAEFIAYLTGRDENSEGAEFDIYSSYTEIGRQKCRFVSISNDAELVRKDGYDILFPKITFKVNDPMTDIVLQSPYETDNAQ